MFYSVKVTVHKNATINKVYFRQRLMSYSNTCSYIFQFVDIK